MAPVCTQYLGTIRRTIHLEDIIIKTTLNEMKSPSINSVPWKVDVHCI
jgi:hypothetical protein